MILSLQRAWPPHWSIFSVRRTHGTVSHRTSCLHQTEVNKCLAKNSVVKRRNTCEALHAPGTQPERLRLSLARCRRTFSKSIRGNTSAHRLLWYCTLVNQRPHEPVG